MEKKEKVEIKRKLLRKEKQEFILDFKVLNGCQKCGWNEHPEVLQFHHKEERGKRYRGQLKSKISILIHSPYNLEALKNEINKKCILLCPNCHAWIHYQER